jgi:hypothetical protein
MLIVEAATSASSNGPQLGLYRYDVVGGNPSRVLSGDNIGQIVWRGYGQTGYAAGSAARITCLASQDIGDSNAHGANLQILTSPINSNAPSSVAYFANTGVQIIGTSTNDDPPAGWQGEYLETIVLTPVSLTSGAAADVAPRSLAAGDWDVWGSVDFAQRRGNGVGLYRLGQQRERDVRRHGDPGAIPDIAATTNSNLCCKPALPASPLQHDDYYLSCRMTFAVNAAAAYGKICARRVR